MFGILARLKAAGVLGLNRRNACYILPYNERRFYPRVDDKLLTKQLMLQAGLPVPELYGVAEVNYQVQGLMQQLSGRPGFVVKPAKGSGGQGIMVLLEAVKDMYRRVDGVLISAGYLKLHVFNVLSGMFSLGGQPDKAIIEERIDPNPLFKKINYRGVPDIRIIVLFGVPVMAMLRLPTSMSRGKANLHLGAVGVGIEMASGRTLVGVHGNSVIFEHPDTAQSLAGVKIPNWDELLHMASRCHELTGLGYQGVDIVLDRAKGPMILEINARPGLNIQLANGTGLLKRLKVVEQHWRELKNTVQRVSFAKEHF